ncbi:MAG: hypothetical protein AB7S38_23050 [Vulcanimicrobiota bacterium]
MSSGKRGLSLLELLVALGLAALGLYLLAAVFLPTLRVSRRTSQRIDLQQSGSMALEKLVVDLGHTPVVGITHELTEPGGRLLFALHPVTGVSADARPTYAGQLIVYSWVPAERTLRRILWPPGGGLTPARARLLDATELATAAEEGEARILCRDLLEFEVSSETNPVSLKMVLGADPRAGEPEQRVEFGRDVLLRN